MSPAAGTVRRAALFVGFCLLVVVARVGFSASSELQRARSLEADSQWHRAAAAYGAAIRMYLPGIPTGRHASERLLALTDRARSAGDRDEARFCLEELRSGWLAVRSTYQPGQRWVTEAESQLAELMLSDERGNWPPRDRSPEERRAIVERTLAERGDPALGWVLLMGLGYLAWIGGAGLAIWQGLPSRPDEPVRWKIVGRWAAASAGGYLLWLLAVANA